MMSVCKANSINSVYVSAAHKSSGKTIVSIGLSRLLKNLNHNVQTFKKGPDYIDMSWLASAAYQKCYNLDFNTQTKKEIFNFYNNKKADFNIIEGNKGLFDGLDLSGKDDNSAMSILLNVPVILVIDTQGITRGIAPLLQGYINFEKKCNIKGVILNKVNNDRHENKLINSIKKYTDLEVLGAIRKNKDLIISERHLGLVPANEKKLVNEKISKISDIIEKSIDKNSFYKFGINFEKNKNQNINKKIYANQSNLKLNKNDIKVGIFYDSSFGFYYADDIENFLRYGAEIVYIDSQKDQTLPDVDALFIGGGFPEINARKIEKNKKLMNSVKKFIEKDHPCYAECGGLMYLAESIRYKNKKYKMTGVIPGNVSMFNKPVGRGYVKLISTKKHPWKIKEKILINAHEFHYAKLNFKKNIRKNFSYTMKRGYGIDSKSDGFVYKNMLANFSHLRHTKKMPWIKYFMNFIKENKK